MEQRIELRESSLRRGVKIGATVAAYVVVYGWSLLFLMLASCLVLPLMVAHSFSSADAEIAGDIVFALTLGALVAASSVFLLRRGVRSSPRKLLAFFYGFEAPMILLIALRLFAIRELTGGAAFVIGCVVLGCFSAAWNVFRPYAHSRRIAHAQLAVATVSAIAALSLAGYYALYLPPVAVSTFTAMFSVETWRQLGLEIMRSHGAAVIWACVGLFFALLSGTLFVAAPFGVIIAHVGAFRDQTRFHRGRFQAPVLTTVIVVGCAAATIGTWLVATRSTTQAELSRIERDLATQSPAAIEALYRREDDVKAALLDAYLAPYRYLGASGQANHIQRHYENAGFGETVSAGAQAIHDTIARPFLYEGSSLQGDQDRAEHLYETLFDAPIQRKERATIDHAFSSTYERLFAKAAASVVDIDAKRARLVRQDVSVREVGGAGEVTIHDEYTNVTNAPQEILYYFELPEDAAITGLWLGNDEHKETAFAYRVAPRGAAQKVYKAEVRRRVDPALVEQVGPRQYRLRAYPVPTDKPLHVWMSYAARPENGVLPKPHVLERRNAFFDRSTAYALGGEAVVANDDDEWVRVTPAMSGSSIPQPLLLGGKQIDRTVRAAREIHAGNGERIAIVVDRSRSMQAHEATVRAALEWAAKELRGYEVDVVLAAAAGSGRAQETHKVTDALDVRGLGSSTLADLVALPPGDYAAAFLLTDDDAYDRAADLAPRTFPTLWIVHHGAPARAYPDAVGDALQRRGNGVAPSLAEAVARWQTFSDARVFAVTDREIWRGEAGRLDRSAAPPSFDEQIAAKLFLSAHAQRRDEREAMHALAMAASVVSPLSSMIVLVDERQHKALDEASKGENKFDREAENGHEKAPGASDAFAVSATPEPEEWMLILCALALLVWTQRRRQFA